MANPMWTPSAREIKTKWRWKNNGKPQIKNFRDIAKKKASRIPVFRCPTPNCGEKNQYFWQRNMNRTRSSIILNWWR